jgi:hypothetical protein
MMVRVELEYSGIRGDVMFIINFTLPAQAGL